MPLTRLPLTTGVSGTLAAGNGGTGVTSADNIGNFVLLNSGTISSVTSFEFDNTHITDTYKFYEVNFTFYTGTNNFDYYLQTSTDNGSNYSGGASDYAWTFTTVGTQGSFSGLFDQDDSGMVLAKNVSDGAGFPISGRVRIMNPTDSTIATTFQSLCVGFHNTNDDVKQLNVFGRRQATEDNDAIKFITTQTMTSGHYALYGVRS